MRAVNKRFVWLCLGICLASLSACSGPQPTDPTNPATPPPLPTSTVTVAEAETFDPAPYREPLPDFDETVAHDVPEQLLQSTADRGLVRIEPGYRIHIFSSLNKDEAVQEAEAAKSWWRAQLRRLQVDSDSAYTAAMGLLPEQLPVYTIYRQPYYRIHVGDFRNRSRAELALELVERRFRDAFIAPDNVQVVR